MGRQLEFSLSYYICIQPNTPLSFLLPYHHRLNTPPTIFIFSLLLKSHPLRFSLPTIPKFHFASIFSLLKSLSKPSWTSASLLLFIFTHFSAGFLQSPAKIAADGSWRQALRFLLVLQAIFLFPTLFPHLLFSFWFM